MSHFSLESVFSIGSKIRPESFSENSLYFCYNQISFSNKLCPITFKKRRGEDEREGGPIVGGEKKDGGKKGGGHFPSPGYIDSLFSAWESELEFQKWSLNTIAVEFASESQTLGIYSSRSTESFC